MSLPYATPTRPEKQSAWRYAALLALLWFIGCVWPIVMAVDRIPGNLRTWLETDPADRDGFLLAYTLFWVVWPTWMLSHLLLAGACLARAVGRSSRGLAIAHLIVTFALFSLWWSLLLFMNDETLHPYPQPAPWSTLFLHIGHNDIVRAAWRSIAALPLVLYLIPRSRRALLRR